MIVKVNERIPEIRKNMRGGDGNTILNAFLSGDGLPAGVRLFSEIVLEQGCGIGYHVHEKEAELFYVLAGTARYSDNGNEISAGAGDVLVCKSGDGHSVRNDNPEALRLIAIIIVE